MKLSKLLINIIEIKKNKLHYYLNLRYNKNECLLYWIQSVPILDWRSYQLKYDGSKFSRWKTV